MSGLHVLDLLLERGFFPSKLVANIWFSLNVRNNDTKRYLCEDDILFVHYIVSNLRVFVLVEDVQSDYSQFLYDNVDISRNTPLIYHMKLLQYYKDCNRYPQPKLYLNIERLPKTLIHLSLLGKCSFKSKIHQNTTIDNKRINFMPKIIRPCNHFGQFNRLLSLSLFQMIPWHYLPPSLECYEVHHSDNGFTSLIEEYIKYVKISFCKSIRKFNVHDFGDYPLIRCRNLTSLTLNGFCNVITQPSYLEKTISPNVLEFVSEYCLIENERYGESILNHAKIFIRNFLIPSTIHYLQLSFSETHLSNNIVTFFRKTLKSVVIKVFIENDADDYQDGTVDETVIKKVSYGNFSSFFSTKGHQQRIARVMEKNLSFCKCSICNTVML